MIRATLSSFSLMEVPVVALLLFILAWMAIVVQAWARNPAEVERLSALPLDEDVMGIVENER